MDNQTKIKVVNLKNLWDIFIQRLWMIGLVAVLATVTVFAVDRLTFEPRYNSTATMYILRQNASGSGVTPHVTDADMRKSVIAGRNTTVSKPRGLSEVLTGLNTLEECIYPVENSSLHILFAGKYPPNPVELLNSKYFEELISKSRENYDYIIVDTPPLGQVIDAAVIAKQCDGVAMIISNSKVHYKAAQMVVDTIEKSGCKMLGVIRNSTKRQKGGYYYRKYGYQSKYGYTVQPEKNK